MLIKKSILGAALFFAAVLTAAAAEPVVTVINSTGNVFRRLFVNSSEYSSLRDPNVLGYDALSDKGWVRVSLSSGTWNFFAITKEGELFVKFDYPVRDGAILEFTAADRSSPQQGAGPVITVINRTGYPLYFLHVSHYSDSEWGDDVLANYMILPEGAVRITLPSVGIWDFKAVDGDGDSYCKWRYGISKDATLEFTWGDFSTG